MSVPNPVENHKKRLKGPKYMLFPSGADSMIHLIQTWLLEQAAQLRHYNVVYKQHEKDYCKFTHLQSAQLIHLHIYVK